MADDEDDALLRGSLGSADIDLSDETQDFRFLNNLTTNATGALSLPKRGLKDFESHETQLQAEILEASRQAMQQVLSWTRVHTNKNRILAIYHPESNMAYVDKVKTQHFQTIGRSRGGKEWLLPEEALFLLERGSLDCRWPVQSEGEEAHTMDDSPPMSLQGAYAAFIGFEEGIGGKLTLEMYTVYSGLKRSGYVVFRTGSWDDDRASLQPAPQPRLEGPQSGIFFRFFAELWRRLSVSQSTVNAIDLRFGPLIRPGLFRTYADIYTLLRLTPSNHHKAPPSFSLPPSRSSSFRIHFDLWKGTSKFRKTQRGPPDFQVCVINAREQGIPTVAELNDLIVTAPYDLPKDTDHMYKKLKHGRRNIILAVVDGGVPSYIQVADAPFEDIKLYERTGRAPRGKGGQGRGGGRGRGRGRGRGG